jgi:hypothetical protein
MHFIENGIRSRLANVPSYTTDLAEDTKASQKWFWIIWRGIPHVPQSIP